MARSVPALVPALLLALACGGTPDAARAARAPVDGAAGALAACAALSPLLDDIHVCLDGYLDTMDDDIAAVTASVEGTLDGEAKAAFARAQAAFGTYRRENCLWYLAFSAPRDEAEQIAKDCLATMSMRRLTELRHLIAPGSLAESVLSGYYERDDERDTFLPCGGGGRYRVEGRRAVIAALRQAYVDATADGATSDGATADGATVGEPGRLFAVVRGSLDERVTGVAADRDGVLDARALLGLRAPREGDCPGPAPGAPGAAGPSAGPPAGSEPATTVADPTAVATAAEPPPEPEPELTGYFGAWLAACTERDARRGCELSTELVAVAPAGGDEGAAGGDPRPRLSLARGAAGRTDIVLRFPGREIDSPAKVRWQVDEDVLGDVLGSSVRVDETAAELRVEDSPYVRETLLPLLRDGGTLVVEVLDSIDDARGERFAATLVGVTRALAFADDFVRNPSDL